MKIFSWHFWPIKRCAVDISLAVNIFNLKKNIIFDINSPSKDVLLVHKLANKSILQGEISYLTRISDRKGALYYFMHWQIINYFNRNIKFEEIFCLFIFHMVPKTGGSKHNSTGARMWKMKNGDWFVVSNFSHRMDGISALWNMLWRILIKYLWLKLRSQNGRETSHLGYLWAMSFFFLSVF